MKKEMKEEEGSNRANYVSVGEEKAANGEV